MFTAITENNHQLHCSGFRKNDSMCEPLCLYEHGCSKSCNIAPCPPLSTMSTLIQAPSATILTSGTLAPSAIWMWAEILFNALLASSGCISFAPFLPVLTFAQSVQLALQWAGDAQHAIPKRKLAPPLRPVSLLRRLRPLPPPPGSPYYLLAFITHVHVGTSHVTLAPFVLSR